MPSRVWKTRFTASLAPIPIVGAPMAGHAGGHWAATVTAAGGLGFLGGGHWLSAVAASEHPSGLQRLHREVELFRDTEKAYRQKKNAIRSRPPFPLCFGFIGHSTFPAGWDRLEFVLQTYRPTIVQFFAPAIAYHSSTGESNVQLAHRYHAQVFAQVGTVAEAWTAIQAGVDGVLVQGSEAGGHGVRRELGSGTLSLVATVLHQLRPQETKPMILAAGGIVDGATMAAAMALGCDGVVVGTRLWATVESLGYASLKQRLVETSSCDDVVRTTTFDAIQNTYSATPWPAPYDSVGAIKNQTYHQWADRNQELALALLDETQKGVILHTYKEACATGDGDIALVHAGEGVGQIHSIDSAYDVVQRISTDAADIIWNLPRTVLQASDSEDAA
jgi:nitronate monooxygenase